MNERPILEEPVYFPPDHSLSLNPHNLSRVYGITIEFDTDGGAKRSMRFEMEVLAKKDTERESWLYQFDRRNLFLNGKRPDTIADRLAFDGGQVLYPLQIEITDNWTTKIIKSRALAIEKLEKLEKITKQVYQSEYIDTYFTNMAETLGDSEKYVKAVEQNLFLSFFFAPLYEIYHVVYDTTETMMQIPIVPFCRPIEYSLEQKVMPKYTRFNTITVTQKGTLTDKRTVRDIAHRFDGPVFTGKGQSKKPTGRFAAKYELHKDTRVIQSVTSEADIDLGEGRSRSFSLQAYYLPERDKIAGQSLFSTIPEPKKEFDVK